ncbi:hypothetical protein GLR48_15650 [Loktanella sp. M215]|nr:hypothetical protein [Loktanella sp. M215]
MRHRRRPPSSTPMPRPSSRPCRSAPAAMSCHCSTTRWRWTGRVRARCTAGPSRRPQGSRPSTAALRRTRTACTAALTSQDPAGMRRHVRPLPRRRHTPRHHTPRHHTSRPRTPRDPVTDTPAPPAVPPARPNRAPVRLRSVTLDDILGTGAILIGTAHLLEHVSDPDGDVLRVVDITASAGTLIPVAGGFLYTPDPGYAGVVQLAYQVSDGQAAVAQMAHLNIRPVCKDGTDAADVLTGTDGVDVIAGGRGDDQIAAQGGDDVIYGGDGADRILGGAGDDLIYGGAGDDIIYGEAGHDRIDGGAGHDMIYGGDGSDVLTGGAGDDALFGGAGSDMMDGGTGDDVLSDGAGSDIVTGGAGSDTVIVSADRADDTFQGDAPEPGVAPDTGAVDTLDFSAVTAPLSIDMTTGVAESTDSGHDSFAGFEVVIAGRGDDVIRGSAADEVIYGADGADAITGGAGDDALFGGTGDDVLSDGAGSDIVTGGAGSDTVIVSADRADDTFQGDAPEPGVAPDTGAVDTLDFSAVTAPLSIDMTTGVADSTDSGHDSFAGFEVLIAGRGDDVIRGSAADETVVDGAGRDTVTLAEGRDRMVVTQDMSADSFDGGAGQDTLDLSQIEGPVVADLSTGRVAGVTGPADSFDSFEVIIGTTGGDRFIIGDGSVTLTGGAGDDVYCFNTVDGIAQNTATITDFGIGDAIETRIWRFFEDDGRDDHGGLRLDGAAPPDTLRPLNLSFSYETGTDGDTTRIDIHEDDMFDAFITLTGHHVLILHDAL